MNTTAPRIFVVGVENCEVMTDQLLTPCHNPNLEWPSSYLRLSSWPIRFSGLSILFDVFCRAEVNFLFSGGQGSFEILGLLTWTMAASAADVRSILSLPSSSTAGPSQLQPKKPTGPSTRKPEGISRELFALIGPSAPSIAAQLAKPRLKQKPNFGGGGKVKWCAVSQTL